MKKLTPGSYRVPKFGQTKKTTSKPIGNEANGQLWNFSSLLLKENKSEVIFVFGKSYFALSCIASYYRWIK